LKLYVLKNKIFIIRRDKIAYFHQHIGEKIFSLCYL